MREDASAALRAVMRPGRKDEAWRRTDLSHVFAASPVMPSGSLTQVHSASKLFLDQRSSDQQEDECASLVFIDGAFSEDLSNLEDLPPGVLAGGMGQLHSSLPKGALELLRGLPEANADPRTALGSYVFAVLNQASLTDVAVVCVSAGHRGAVVGLAANC